MIEFWQRKLMRYKWHTSGCINAKDAKSHDSKVSSQYFQAGERLSNKTLMASPSKLANAKPVQNPGDRSSDSNWNHPVQTTRKKSGVGIQKSRVESGRVPKDVLNLLKARILFPTFSSWTKINLKIHLSNIPQPEKPNFCTAQQRHLGP